jgi:hypothetical protein
MRYRRWFVAIATTVAVISLQGPALALSRGSSSASIAQSEAASIASCVLSVLVTWSIMTSTEQVNRHR